MYALHPMNPKRGRPPNLRPHPQAPPPKRRQATHRMVCMGQGLLGLGQYLGHQGASFWSLMLQSRKCAGIRGKGYLETLWDRPRPSCCDVCVYIKYTRTQTHTHTHVYVYIYICVCVCDIIYIYIHMWYIYIYADNSKYIHSLMSYIVLYQSMS